MVLWRAMRQMPRRVTFLLLNLLLRQRKRRSAQRVRSLTSCFLLSFSFFSALSECSTRADSSVTSSRAVSSQSSSKLLQTVMLPLVLLTVPSAVSYLRLSSICAEGSSSSRNACPASRKASRLWFLQSLSLRLHGLLRL